MRAFNENSAFLNQGCAYSHHRANMWLAHPSKQFQRRGLLLDVNLSHIEVIPRGLSENASLLLYYRMRLSVTFH